MINSIIVLREILGRRVREEGQRPTQCMIEEGESEAAGRVDM